MKLLSLTIVLSGLFAVGVFFLINSTNAATATTNPLPEVLRYRIDASKSKFFVHANRAGVAYFKGKSHLIAVRDFDGEASLSLDAVNPASLQMTIRAASLEETSDVFTPQQKGIINGELKDLVLETAKYPDITFKSTDVKGTLKDGSIDVKIGGDITLHGVTRHIVIPATVTVEGDAFHAKGKFDLNRKKFNVNATNAFHGTVRIKHTLKFDFDIVGQKIR